MRRRVEKRKMGYAEKKRTVTVPRSNAAVEAVVARRVEEGYRASYVRRPGGRERQLAYTALATPRRQERKALATAGRERRLTAAQRWARQGEAGLYRRETTEGRRTHPEARRKELGGIRRLWVR